MGDPFQPIKPFEKFNKEIEKVKADNEKLPVKEKFEKAEKREKIEIKEGKLEVKEGKREVKENKFEIKEHKGDKEKVEVKENKFEIKEVKIEKLENEDVKLVREKDLKEAEGPDIPDLRTSPLLDREMLVRHAETLESMGRELRHFIEQVDRPDLSRGALRDEPDQGDQNREGEHRDGDHQ